MANNKSKKKDSIKSIAPRMPENLNVEANIIACLCKQPDKAGAILAKLDEDCFSSEKNKNVFIACRNLYNDGKEITPLLIQEQLETDRNNFLDSFNYLVNINMSAIDTINWEEYVQVLNKLKYFRTLIKVSDDIKDLGLKATDENQARASLLDVIEKISSIEQEENYVHVEKVSHEYIAKVNKIIAGEDVFRGLYTGYSIFDKITNGLMKNAVYILAARPGIGKTSFALNVVNNIIDREHKNPKITDDKKSVIVFFSLEMSTEELYGRLLTINSGDANVDMKKVSPNKELIRKISNTSEVLSNSKLYLNTNASVTPDDILTTCQSIHSIEGKIDLVIIDYLQLLTLPRNSGSITQDVTRISRDIKKIAMKLGVPILALSQMSREIESQNREDKTPKLSDLRDSGAIEQDADVVCFISKEEDITGQHVDNLIISIVKNRHGTQKMIRYNWDASIVSFRESDNPHIYPRKNAYSTVNKSGKKSDEGNAKADDFANAE